MKKLTREQILNIPKLKEQGLLDREIAERMKISERQIGYWKRRLKDEKGITMPKLTGKHNRIEL